MNLPSRASPSAREASGGGRFCHIALSFYCPGSPWAVTLVFSIQLDILVSSLKSDDRRMNRQVRWLK
jgi:hypothetical protein